MTQAEYEKTDSFKRKMWINDNEDDANRIVGWKTFDSLLENLPQLKELRPHYKNYYPGWADNEGGTGEGYLEFTLTFYKNKEDFPEVQMPNIEGWAESDIHILRAILLKQEFKKKYEVLSKIDSFTVINYWQPEEGFGTTEHLTITYKIWSDAEMSDRKEFYDYFSEEDITDEEIKEFSGLYN